MTFFSEKISRFQKPSAILTGRKVIFTNHEVRRTKNARDVFRSQLETTLTQQGFIFVKARRSYTQPTQIKKRL